MRQSLRLFWRTARFEILAGIALSIALTALMLVVAFRLDDIRVTECAGTLSCPTSAWYDIDTGWAEPLMSAMALWPFVVGLLYGPALVGRELEHRTAPLAWSLTRDRTAWLLWRLVSSIGLTLVLLVVPAAAAWRLEAAHHPLVDVSASFYDHGLFGSLVVARGLAALSIGVAAGVVLGRILPAIIASAAIGLLGLVLAGALVPAWMPREEVPLDVVSGLTREAPLLIGDGYRLPDGRLLTFSESEPLRPPEARALDTTTYRKWLRSSGWDRVEIGIRGTRIGEIVLRESIATLGVALLAIVTALVLVRRRRPVPGLAPELDTIRGQTVAQDLSFTSLHSPAWRRTAVWLGWRMTARVGRPELMSAVFAAVLVTGLAVAWTWLLHQGRIEQGCLDTDCLGEGPFARWNGPMTDWLYPPLATLPFVVGALLGAPLVAREFESGSAQLTFSLVRSRLRWLLWRAAIPLALVVLLLVPAAVAGAGALHEAMLLDPSYFISGDQIRGAGLVARGIAVFGLAVLAGVLTRRVLPALVLSLTVGVLLYNALDWALPRWVPAEPVAMDAEVPGSYSAGMIVRDPDGSLYDPRALATSLGYPGPGPEGNADFQTWLDANGFEMMALDIPASRYPEIVTRESLTLIAVGSVALAGAGILLRDRRPR